MAVVVMVVAEADLTAVVVAVASTEAAEAP